MLARILLWPVAILAALVVYGLWQRRPCTVSRGTPAIVAVVFLGLSLYGVIGAFGVALPGLGA